MADPLEALRQPATPIAPDPAFSARLKSRLAAALGRTPPGASMSDTTTDARTGIATDVAASAPTPDYVQPGYRTLTPYICVHDGRAALDWYTEVLGATVRGEVIVMADGRVGHAELAFGEVTLMLAEEFPEMGLVSPRSQEGHSSSLSLYVPDVDATYAHALDRGATGERPPEDYFYGARTGWFQDPFGHRWSVQTPLAADATVPPRPDDIARCRSAPPTAGPQAVGELGYFTLTTPDVDRAAAFYGALFGWAAADATPTQDGRHRYRHVGNTTLPFGFVDNPDSPSPDHYYRVDDLKAMVARVRDLGGKVVSVAKYESGGNAVCKDDQGTVFQLWQPAPGY